MDPANFPPPKMMSLPPGVKDRRKIMATVYSLFRGEATENDLAKQGLQSQADEFYSLFYLGLYCEIRGENAKAESYMRKATMGPYATGAGQRDYMTAVARVHCKVRNWS
mmetsp:Transcript_35468/g.54516  ORF Transcript_35468/g.54516 Transcript_35468/m.54516 type:complete len:109 (-) Transcript_35468:49-375(-)